MKKRYFAALMALLLCCAICLSGCSSFSYEDTDYSYTESPRRYNELPIYNPGILSLAENDTLTPDNDNTNTVDPSKYRPYYALGSNKYLEGTITVIFIFVDEYYSSWTENEVIYFLEYQALPAMDYLVEEAEKWGIELELNVSYYSTPTSGGTIRYDGRIGTAINSENDMSEDVMEDICLDIGYYTPEEMLADHRQEYGTEIAYINVFDTVGRSYTFLQSANPSVEYVEHAIIFRSYGDPYTDESRSPTIAQEFLHLYGAEDFYTPDNRARIAERTYPNELMLISATNLSQVNLSEVTAYLIGWSDDVPSMCLTDAWKSGYTSK